MAKKRKTKKPRKTKRKVTKHRRKKKPKSLLEKIKHWLKKRAQGLPMTTIVIIIIVLIVLAVVVIFFFGQFTTGQETVGAQQQIGNQSVSQAQIEACCKFRIGCAEIGITDPLTDPKCG